jgi:hypothetical protein
MANMPFIPQERVFQSMLYVENEISGKENTYVPDEDDIALIYSLKACILTTIEMYEQAEFAFEKSRTFIMTKFDQILKNITLAACSLFLGCYCVLNDDERSLLFLGNVKTFFERNVNMVATPSVELLRQIFNDISSVAVCNADMERNIKTMIHRLKIMEDWKGINDQSTEIPWRISAEEMDKITSDITQNTDLYELVPERVMYIAEKMSQLQERLIGKVSEETRARLNTRMTLFLQGAVAQRCFRFGQYKEAIQTADSIAQATLLPSFEKGLLQIGAVITLAANIHLHSYCMFDELEIKENALQQLQLELNALTCIRNKNSIFGPSLDDIVERIQTMLKTAQEQTIVSQLATQINSYQFGHTVEEVVLNSAESELKIESEIEDDGEVDIIDKFFEDFM